MEATRGYETALVCTRQAAAPPVAVINPSQARDFARTMGCLGQDRSDRRPDAGRVRLGPGPPQRPHALPAAAARRAPAVAGHLRHPPPPAANAARRRAPTPSDPPEGLHHSSQTIIKAVQAQLDDFKAEMLRHVRTHFGDLDRILRLARGIGPVASAPSSRRFPSSAASTAARSLLSSASHPDA